MWMEVIEIGFLILSGFLVYQDVKYMSIDLFGSILLTAFLGWRVITGWNTLINQLFEVNWGILTILICIMVLRGYLGGGDLLYLTTLHFVSPFKIYSEIGILPIDGVECSIFTFFIAILLITIFSKMVGYRKGNENMGKKYAPFIPFLFVGYVISNLMRGENG
ncbi:hypothetical protein B6U74_05580 [Candidatus Bathyarchaeota archaeon ex4484_205]|nr:MAG: hypothetical protein B6U74_05580 [Candidatus Bathyarchaeota archaeon ex4484_205]